MSQPADPTAPTTVSGVVPEPRAGADTAPSEPSPSTCPRHSLVDLRSRVAATRLPSKELVADRSQGVQLATMQALARYWATEYDWRACEKRLNELPQFMTEIDGVDIHFIHVKSRHENALPLIMTHGWPGSVIELLETVGPLTDPTAHGGRRRGRVRPGAAVLPGYGFSGEPTELGWDSGRTARAWAELMRPPRLPPLRRPGRRRGCPRHGPDGPPGGRGPGRLPPEPAHRGARHRRSPAQGNRRGTRRGRGVRDLQGGRLRLLPRDGHAAPDDRLRHARTHPSRWRPGCSTTTPTATTRSPARSSTASRSAISPATPSSTTSRCTG